MTPDPTHRMARPELTTSRRRLLAAAPFVGLALVAGCTRDGERGGTQPTAPASDEPSALSAPDGTPSAAKRRPPQPVPGKVMLGAYLSLKGLSQEASFALRRQQLGHDLRILHRYYKWTDWLPTAPDNLPHDCFLLISWDGVPYSKINSGSQDELIERAADAMAKYAEPMFIRWAWEMNGNWYNWGGSENGNDPGGFVTAWRRIHDIFRRRGATNVGWVWGPNAHSHPDAAWNDMTAYYPGDQYVDWVGVSGYFGHREAPDYLFRPVLDDFGRRKPIMIAETGALERGGTVKADWINELAAWIKANPAVAALVWFDTDNDKHNTKNWRIDSTPSSLAAYQRLAADPHFQA